MKVSINWLKDYVTFDENIKTLDTVFSLKSQEVETTYKLVNANNLVIGYTKDCYPHPDADKLNVCEVDVKTETLTIVCGAPNVKKGQHVIVAKPGAVLPNGLKIKKAKLRGVESNGMICSLSELGIEHKYHNEDGIHVIKDDVTIGDDALKALHLDDEVLVLDLTPNRMDLLSMHGVAYDVAAMLDKPLSINTPNVDYSSEKNPMAISTDTDNCYSYYGSVLDNITIKESPLWMKARLIAAGIRPINNVVDITNYVMLETGQPLHAFDFDLLDSHEIIVRQAKENETFVTLDDKKRTLHKDDIVITNGKKPIALAGVMGGAETEVHAKTNKILLESAVFNPVNVRKTSSRLDLRSESSMRFERRVDVGKTRFALDRATELFIKYAGASVRKDVAYFDHTKKSSHTITITKDTINNVLGSTYTMTHIASIFNRLRFEFKTDGDTFHITKPTRRPDFETYQDLIEEVGRISGYDDLPNTLPDTISTGYLSAKQHFRRQVKSVLNGLGLDEVITYNLVEKKHLNRFTLNKDLTPVDIKNPMSDTRTTLRLTPLNGLLDVVRYNMSRQADHVHIFEVGKRYTKDKETEVLSIAMSGSYHDQKWQTTTPTTFFTVKGIFEALISYFDLDVPTYESIQIENYHPHQTAHILMQDDILGHIGKVHPNTASDYDLDDVFLLEVNLDQLFSLSTKETRFESLPKFPSISRDIAIVLKEDIPAQAVLDTIKQATNKSLINIDIFDVYAGKHMESGKKSLGIRMIFNNKEKTLKAEEIDSQITRILNALKETHNAILR